ncbi:V-set domain-containing T-cell activation inhibitor 1-like [Heptranchias perlo]|uniref:V-set domain-containing T-cell activation inhibitor 1-like n=1 Tax=Heptranchias perlo TaxID=212740 RepID=UPI0035597F69
MAVGRVLLLVLLMIVTLTSAKNSLQCTRQADELTVTNGGSVFLPCSFNWTGPSPEVCRVVWKKEVKGGDPLVVHTRDRKTENKNQGSEFVGRTALAADWFERRDAALNLTGVSVRDTGTYECHIVTQRPHNSENCAAVTLSVATDAAEITTLPSMLLIAGLALVPFFS